MSDFPILSPNSDSCTKKSLPFLGLFALSAISITFSRDRFSVSSAFANGAASSPRTHVVNHPLRWRYEISAAAIGLLVSLLVVGSAALISVPTGVVRTTAATPTSSSSTTFANAPGNVLTQRDTPERGDSECLRRGGDLWSFCEHTIHQSLGFFDGWAGYLRREGRE